MGFSPKFYEKAEQIMKKRRDDNDELLEKRKAEIRAKFPKYIEYETELRSTGEELYRIFSSSNEGIKEKLNALETRNLDAQRKIHELLLTNRYKQDYLEKISDCKKCKDSGIYKNHRCSCFMDVVKSLASKEFNENSPIKLSSFDTFDLKYYKDETDSETGINIKRAMEKNLQYCLSYAENFHLPSEGIVLIGRTGLGKTHLSLAIANEVLKKGYSVIYGSAPDIFHKLEKEHFGRENGNFEELLQDVDLLILDDLGAEFDTNFYNSALYNIVNTRMNLGKPEIINTNLSVNELQNRYGERMISRLLSNETLTFFGSDIRIEKKWRKS